MPQPHVHAVIELSPVPRAAASNRNDLRSTTDSFRTARDVLTIGSGSLRERLSSAHSVWMAHPGLCAASLASLPVPDDLSARIGLLDLLLLDPPADRGGGTVSASIGAMKDDQVLTAARELIAIAAALDRSSRADPAATAPAQLSVGPAALAAGEARPAPPER